MTDIERMAREAGFDSSPDGHIYPDDSAAREPITEALTRFAALVRAQALEDAAKYLQDVHPTRLVKFADAIRVLGRKV
jgi:hypothetical protein